MADAVINRIKDSVTKFSERIDEIPAIHDLLENFENATGIKGSYALSAASVGFLIFFLLSSGPMIFLDALLILYPAYKSYRFMERTEVREFHWLKYWIIFSLFQEAGNFLWWIPGFQLSKFLFLFWCLIPMSTNGSTVVYDRYIKPIFEKNSETVEGILNFVQSLISKVTSKVNIHSQSLQPGVNPS